MEIEKSHIVISLAGRDKGKLFFVSDRDADNVYLADGKCRKLAKPKRKNLTHIRFVSESGDEVAEAIRGGGRVSDKDLRKWLAVFKAGTGNDKGGTYVWQKTI